VTGDLKVMREMLSAIRTIWVFGYKAYIILLGAVMDIAEANQPKSNETAYPS